MAFKDAKAIFKAKAGVNDQSDNGHRQLIGWIGLILPLLLIGLAILRDKWEGWRNLESVSAYYYSGGAALFVGMLMGLALYLATYDGAGGKWNKADQIAAKTAAFCAVIVALFPTKAPVGFTALSWWTEETGKFHYWAAGILFTMFAVFALFLFQRTSDGAPPDSGKKWRNTIYLVCGLAIVAAMGWAGYNATHGGKEIFWPESLALFAFSISWLVKGHAHRTIAALVTK